MKSNPNITSLAAGLIALAAFPAAHAGTANVDFQGSGGDVMNGPGVIGKGSHWGPFHPGPGVSLVRDDGTHISSPVGTTIGVNRIGGGLPIGFTTGSTNNLLKDGVRSGTSGIEIVIVGLRPDVSLKLVVYVGPLGGTPSQRVTVVDTGESKVITGGDVTGPLSNAVEGAAYVIFDGADPGPDGILTIRVLDLDSAAGAVCGLQLQGWFPDEEFASRADLLTSKSRNSGYKGNNQYGGGQTLTLTGQRRGKAYFRLQNDADICARYRLKSKGSDTKAVRKWFDITKGRKNITATVASGKFETSIDAGKSVRIQTILRPKRGIGRAASVLKAFAAESGSLSKHGDKAKLVVKP